MIICGVYLAEKGFGFGHDSNFFLLEDGKINCHVELERYLDEKNVRVGLNQFFEILNEFVPPNEVDLYAINFRKKRKQ